MIFFPFVRKSLHLLALFFFSTPPPPTLFTFGSRTCLAAAAFCAIFRFRFRFAVQCQTSNWHQDQGRCQREFQKLNKRNYKHFALERVLPPSISSAWTHLFRGLRPRGGLSGGEQSSALYIPAFSAHLAHPPGQS